MRAPWTAARSEAHRRPAPGTFAAARRSRLIAGPLAIGVRRRSAGRAVEVRGAAASSHADLRRAARRPGHSAHPVDHRGRRGMADTRPSPRWSKGNQGPSSFAWGLRYSVWCAEEMPFQDPARIASQVSPALGLGGINEGDGHAGRVPGVERDARRCRRKHDRSLSDVACTRCSPASSTRTRLRTWGRGLLEHDASTPRYVELRGREPRRAGSLRAARRSCPRRFHVLA